MTVNATANHGGSASAIGAEKISVNIEHRHDQPDIRLAFVVVFADMLAIENGEPNAEHDQPGGEWEEMGRVEEVEHAAGGGEDREGADAARTPDVAMGEEVLIGEAEKQAQARSAVLRRVSEGAEIIEKSSLDHDPIMAA